MIEWSDGTRDFKAREDSTYFWLLLCGKGCSMFLANDTQEPRPEWSMLTCPRDGTPFRFVRPGA